jgi:hypothetical protein
MSNKNYSTTRNTELKFWKRISNPLSTEYDKFEMLKKLQVLHEAKPKAPIWIDLINWLQLDRRLSYKQQTAIDIAFKEVQKKSSIKAV